MAYMAALRSVQGEKNDLTASHPSHLEDPHYSARFINANAETQKREGESDIEINSIGFWSREETADSAET